VILKELVLHNVGTFAGKNHIDLSPPSGDKPIVLIGGLNGAGKTTILESIQLVLYGPLAQGLARRTGSYESYLRGLIHRASPADEGASVALRFTAYREGMEHEYWVRRSWHSTGKGVREFLLTQVDGKHNPALASTWNEHVETFLPRGIAGLFFFDGEQIEALADMEKSQKVLGSALSALLGMDLVDRLTTDLAVIRRRHRGEQVPEELRQAVEEKRQLVTAHRQAEESAVEVEAARRTDVERCSKLYFQATETFRAAGGDLLEQRESAEATAASVRTSLARAEDDLRERLAEHAPLLLVEDDVRRLAAQVRAEVDATRNRLMLDELGTRDQKLLLALEEAAADRGALEAAEAFLNRDRKRRRDASSAEEYIGLSEASPLETLSTATLPDVRARLQDGLRRRAELREELDQSERVLTAIPDPESLAPLRIARDEARDELLRAEAALAVASETLQRVRNDRAKANAAYENALDKAAQANLSADDDRRLVDHVDRVRSTLESLKLEATRRHLARISALILEALGLLLRKERLITDVAIDPETYEVSLTGVDGRPLSAADLSAGERQLLAVALLWGLARAAGQPLPIVVDTPLGRLDGSHRHHLLERYFPHASHQVILLSTDTEIDVNAFSLISPHVGREYRLEFDGHSGATSVHSGYFWK
jgi:DNA sulfur modification protein DndD